MFRAGHLAYSRSLAQELAHARRFGPVGALIASRLIASRLRAESGLLLV